MFQGATYDKYNDQERRRHALRLLSIAADGLAEFYNEKGRFPLNDGKYFFDSIKVFLDDYPEDDMFQFVFVTERDQFGYVERIVGQPSKERLMEIDSCYLATWQHQSYISYISPKQGSHHYLLYWVGLNWEDENGKGDDVVYDANSR